MIDERKIRLPVFDRFRGGNVGDTPEKGFGEDFDNSLEDGFSDGFDNGFSDGFNDDFDDGLSDGFDGTADQSDANAEYEDWNGKEASESSDGGAEQVDAKGRSVDVSLRESLGTLFRAIAKRFGKEGREREAGIPESDASFAESYDNSLDEGLVNDEPFNEDADGTEYAEADYFASGQDGYEGYDDIPLNQERQTFSGDDRDYPARRIPQDVRDDAPFDDRFRDFSEDGFAPDDSGRYYGTEVERNGDFEETSDDDSDENGEYDESEEEGGLFSAIGAAFAKFRRRLPSFRPKLYVTPESVYKPEDDGIEKPTLAADIRRIIEEQNRLGETEQEYDRMRSYIRTVSTDTRLRPEDVRQPENLEEIRAAENELYDLIDMISTSNERQRSMIGVYEPPREEDPYNFRGINDDRQFYTDMEACSFEMGSRYGFESEEKISSARFGSGMERNSFSSHRQINNSQEPDYFGKGYGGYEGSPGDDNGGFSNEFGGRNNGFGNGLGEMDGGFDDDLGDINDGFGNGLGEMDGGFDDDLGDINDGFGNAPGEKSEGFDNRFQTDKGSYSDRNGRRVKVRSRSSENAADSASSGSGLSVRRAERATGRGTSHRRGRR